jgi:hypothetical protein
VISRGVAVHTSRSTVAHVALVLRLDLSNIRADISSPFAIRQRDGKGVAECASRLCAGENVVGACVIAKHLIKFVVTAATSSLSPTAPVAGVYLWYCGLVQSVSSVSERLRLNGSPIIGHYSHSATFSHHVRCQASWSADSKGTSRVWPSMLRSNHRGNPTAITAMGLGLIN